MHIYKFYMHREGKVRGVARTGLLPYLDFSSLLHNHFWCYFHKKINVYIISIKVMFKKYFPFEETLDSGRK